MRKIIRVCSILCALVLIAPTATASLITSDLNITGNVEFDVGLPGDPLNAAGNASQTADMTFMQGGGSSLTTINNVTPTGANPLGGILTDYGDGVGVNARVSSNGVGLVPGFFFDFDFSLSNSSATDDYQVFFELVFSNFANADGSNQADQGAFIDSKFRFDNSPNGPSFDTDLLSDTVFFDQNKGVDLTSSGAALSESGNYLFDITLFASTSDSFSAELLMDGEVFDSSSLFNARSSAFIRVLSATNLTNTSPPSQVPEPSTVMLFIVAMALFQLKRRAKN